MTAGHLFFALVSTARVLVAMRLEERDLLTALGEDHAGYRAQVPMLIPGLRRAPGEPVAPKGQPSKPWSDPGFG